MDEDRDDPDGTGSSPRDAPTPIRYELTESEQLSTALVRAVAATNGRRPADLPPLNRYVDPDALDALVATAPARRNGGVRVSFSYAGVDVRVDSADGITVWPATDEEH